MLNVGDCASATRKLSTFFKEIPKINEIYKKAQKLDKKSILFFKQNSNYGIKRIFFEDRLYTLDELLNLPTSVLKFKRTKEKIEKINRKIPEELSKNTSEQKLEKLKKKLKKRYGPLFAKAMLDFIDEPQITGADLAIWAGVSRQRIHQLLSVIHNGTKRPKRASLFKKYVNIPHKPQLVGILQRLSRYGTLQQTKDNNVWLVNGLRVRIIFTKNNRLVKCPTFCFYCNANVIVVICKDSRFIFIPKNPYIKQTSISSSTVLEGYEKWDLLEEMLKD